MDNMFKSISNTIQKHTKVPPDGEEVHGGQQTIRHGSGWVFWIWVIELFLIVEWVMNNYSCEGEDALGASLRKVFFQNQSQQ